MECHSRLEKKRKNQKNQKIILDQILILERQRIQMIQVLSQERLEMRYEMGVLVEEVIQILEQEIEIVRHDLHDIREVMIDCNMVLNNLI